MNKDHEKNITQSIDNLCENLVWSWSYYRALSSLHEVARNWQIHLKPDKSLEDISRMFNPVLRGWNNYYGRFYKSALYPVLRHMNRALVHWARRKYKRLSRHRRRAEYWLGRIAKREPQLFVHWQMGILPTAVYSGDVFRVYSGDRNSG